MDTKEIQLIKLFLIPNSPELERVYGKESFYEFKKESLGLFDSKDDAMVFLNTYQEINHSTFAYELVGPEHGHGESQFVLNEDDGMFDEIFETEHYDESPEFQYLYDSNKKLISSYFYDKNKPGGERLDGEHIFAKGDKAYVMISIFVGKKNHDLLLPVIIQGKLTADYLHEKWKKALWDNNKRINSEENASEPTHERILKEIEDLSNFEKDSIIFKPLTTIKCNWGEEPTTPFDDAPRIDFLTFKSILSHETKFS